MQSPNEDRPLDPPYPPQEAAAPEWGKRSRRRDELEFLEGPATRLG